MYTRSRVSYPIIGAADVSMACAAHHLAPFMLLPTFTACHRSCHMAIWKLLIRFIFQSITSLRTGWGNFLLTALQRCSPPVGVHHYFHLIRLSFMNQWSSFSCLFLSATMRSQAHYLVRIHVRIWASVLVTNESRIFFFIYNLDNYLKMSQFPWPNIISFIFSLSCMHDYFTLKIPHSNNVWSLFLSNLVTARIGWYESLNQEIVWFNLFSGLVRFLRC